MTSRATPRTGRTVPLPDPATAATWQVGVGPGAVVVHLSPGGDTGGQRRTTSEAPAGPASEPLSCVLPLAQALAQGAGPPDVAGPAPARAPEVDADPAGGLGTAVRVRGAGPIARRLRRTLAPVLLDGEDEDGRAPEVAVHQHVVPPDVGLAAARSGRTVLPVVVQPRRVVVGPVTVPTGPCLHCLDLHRRDRDPRWAVVATHLGHPVEQVRPTPVPEVLQAAAEGLVLLLLEAVRDRRPVQPGLTHEVGLQTPHVVTRRWPVHPACPWHPGDPGDPG
ncbi:hypothetical protein [Ornithinimicrobium kibberense]|uniref:Bacteriocin biosynthesis cyclodehydratase domain-containing protein n=1 Tax=Ornithinimicrobium kibberense TaxID=282060 RepID=A0ABV5V080_9MICO|nr:hypothetical protein [Ornithinimicrobium kibberense]